MSKPQDADQAPASPPGGWFPWLCGFLIGLLPLKFGDPIIFPSDMEMPSDPILWIFLSWPLNWGFWLLGLTFIASFFAGPLRLEGPRKWLLLLAGWYLWQWVAHSDSVDKALSGPALAHFTGCVACLWLGMRARPEGAAWSNLMMPVTILFLFCIWSGFEQHFWGLEELRKTVEENPSLVEGMHPWVLARLQSDRIYGPLFYPNAYAAAMVVWAPICMGFLLHRFGHLPGKARWAMPLLLVLPCLACLYWTRSKTAILVALLLMVISLLRLPFDRKLKIRAITALGVVGLIGFFIVFAEYFQKGALSLGARFHYWEVAWKITLKHPFNGTGPATFQRPFETMKAPDAEMARLAHNDFLEQGSDSGIPGFLFFTGFFVWGLAWTGRKVWKSEDPVGFSLWLGVLGWSLMALMEFTFYITGIAWPVFFFLGVLATQAGRQEEAREGPTARSAA